MPGNFLADPRGRYPMYCASGSFYEHVLREQVESRSGIDIRYDVRVTGLVFTEDASDIRGVRVSNSGSETEILDVDFVVDAIGRRSRTPTWLGDAELETPRVDEVTVALVA